MPVSEEIYCASCYGKNFGPKGYGYGGGAGTLSMDAGKDSSGQKWATSNIPSTGGGVSSSGSGPKCPRCVKTVYEAEKVIGAGQVKISNRFKIIIAFVGVSAAIIEKALMQAEGINIGKRHINLVPDYFILLK